MFAAPSIVARCQLVLTLLLLFQSSESFRSYKNELPSAPLAEVSSTASSSERQSRQWSWGSRLRGGDAKIVTARPELTYAENMVAGGLSRAAAQGICHPLNVCKTLLQARGDGAVASLPILFRTVAANPRLLTRGILAQTTLSIPNGAVSYATLECTKNALLAAVPPAVATSYRPVLDLVSSACGTLLTSLISVPQTVLLDRTMAGQYPSLGVGARRLAASEGLRGFYRGWAPAMISKIPSYALTWTFFQSAKRMHNRLTGQEATSPVANFVLGALASGLSVCVTIPMVRKDALSRGERDIRIDATTDCLLRSHFLRPN